MVAAFLLALLGASLISVLLPWLAALGWLQGPCGSAEGARAGRGCAHHHHPGVAEKCLTRSQPP
jgi:hypothetical protein